MNKDRTNITLNGEDVKILNNIKKLMAIDNIKLSQANIVRKAIRDLEANLIKG